MTTLETTDKLAISRGGTTYAATIGDVAGFSASQVGAGGSGGPAARQPGDVFLSFDVTPPINAAELNGATLANGAADYPLVAARYPWMVLGLDLILPDTRGQFVRGWDHGAGVDPQASARQARSGDGAKGDLPGTLQGGEIQSHDHSYYLANAFLGGGSQLVQFPSNPTIPSTLRTVASGGQETRPLNIAMMFFMALG